MTYAKSLPPLPVRFWAKVDRSGACWIWLAAITSTGYGVIRIDNRLEKAHRVAYRLEVGPIPQGLQLDHKCHNRACVRPDHLQVVTNKVNQENRQGAQANNRSSGRRGVTWHAANGMWRIEACHNGVRHSGGYFHDLDEADAAAKALRSRLFSNNLRDAS